MVNMPPEPPPFDDAAWEAILSGESPEKPKSPFNIIEVANRAGVPVDAADNYAQEYINALRKRDGRGAQPNEDIITQYVQGRQAWDSGVTLGASIAPPATQQIFARMAQFGVSRQEVLSKLGEAGIDPLDARSAQNFLKNKAYKPWFEQYDLYQQRVAAGESLEPDDEFQRVWGASRKGVAEQPFRKAVENKLAQPSDLVYDREGPVNATLQALTAPEMTGSRPGTFRTNYDPKNPEKQIKLAKGMQRNAAYPFLELEREGRSLTEYTDLMMRGDELPAQPFTRGPAMLMMEDIMPEGTGVYYGPELDAVSTYVRRVDPQDLGGADLVQPGTVFEDGPVRLFEGGSDQSVKHAYKTEVLSSEWNPEDMKHEVLLKAYRRAPDVNYQMKTGSEKALITQMLPGAYEDAESPRGLRIDADRTGNQLFREMAEQREALEAELGVPLQDFARVYAKYPEKHPFWHYAAHPDEFARALGVSEEEAAKISWHDEGVAEAVAKDFKEQVIPNYVHNMRHRFVVEQESMSLWADIIDPDLTVPGEVEGQFVVTSKDEIPTFVDPKAALVYRLQSMGQDKSFLSQEIMSQLAEIWPEQHQRFVDKGQKYVERAEAIERSVLGTSRRRLGDLLGDPISEALQLDKDSAQNLIDMARLHAGEDLAEPTQLMPSQRAFHMMKAIDENEELRGAHFQHGDLYTMPPGMMPRAGGPREDQEMNSISATFAGLVDSVAANNVGLAERRAAQLHKKQYELAQSDNVQRALGGGVFSKEVLSRPVRGIADTNQIVLRDADLLRMAGLDPEDRESPQARAFLEKGAVLPVFHVRDPSMELPQGNTVERAISETWYHAQGGSADIGGGMGIPGKQSEKSTGDADGDTEKVVALTKALVWNPEEETYDTHFPEGVSFITEEIRQQHIDRVQQDMGRGSMARKWENRSLELFYNPAYEADAVDVHRAGEGVAQLKKWTGVNFNLGNPLKMLARGDEQMYKSAEDFFGYIYGKTQTPALLPEEVNDIVGIASSADAKGWNRHVYGDEDGERVWFNEDPEAPMNPGKAYKEALRLAASSPDLSVDAAKIFLPKSMWESSTELIQNVRSAYQSREKDPSGYRSAVGALFGALRDATGETDAFNAAKHSIGGQVILARQEKVSASKIAPALGGDFKQISLVGELVGLAKTRVGFDKKKQKRYKYPVDFTKYMRERAKEVTAALGVPSMERDERREVFGGSSHKGSKPSPDELRLQYVDALMREDDEAAAKIEAQIAGISDPTGIALSDAVAKRRIPDDQPAAVPTPVTANQLSFPGMGVANLGVVSARQLGFDMHPSLEVVPQEQMRLSEAENPSPLIERLFNSLQLGGEEGSKQKKSSSRMGAMQRVSAPGEAVAKRRIPDDQPAEEVVEVQEKYMAQSPQKPGTEGYVEPPETHEVVAKNVEDELLPDFNFDDIEETSYGEGLYIGTNPSVEEIAEERQVIERRSPLLEKRAADAAARHEALVAASGNKPGESSAQNPTAGTTPSTSTNKLIESPQPIKKTGAGPADALRKADAQAQAARATQPVSSGTQSTRPPLGSPQSGGGSPPPPKRPPPPSTPPPPKRPPEEPPDDWFSTLSKNKPGQVPANQPTSVPQPASNPQDTAFNLAFGRKTINDAEAWIKGKDVGITVPMREGGTRVITAGRGPTEYATDLLRETIASTDHDQAREGMRLAMHKEKADTPERRAALDAAKKLHGVQEGLGMQLWNVESVRDDISKRIEQGVRLGVIQRDKADELLAKVQAVTPEETRAMENARAAVQASKDVFGDSTLKPSDQYSSPKEVKEALILADKTSPTKSELNSAVSEQKKAKLNAKRANFLREAIQIQQQALPWQPPVDISGMPVNDLRQVIRNENLGVDTRIGGKSRRTKEQMVAEIQAARDIDQLDLGGLRRVIDTEGLGVSVAVGGKAGRTLDDIRGDIRAARQVTPAVDQDTRLDLLGRAALSGLGSDAGLLDKVMTQPHKLTTTQYAKMVSLLGQDEAKPFFAQAQALAPASGSRTKSTSSDKAESERAFLQRAFGARAGDFDDFLAQEAEKPGKAGGLAQKLFQSPGKLSSLEWDILGRAVGSEEVAAFRAEVTAPQEVLGGKGSIQQEISKANQDYLKAVQDVTEQLRGRGESEELVRKANDIQLHEHQQTVGGLFREAGKIGGASAQVSLLQTDEWKEAAKIDSQNQPGAGMAMLQGVKSLFTPFSPTGSMMRIAWRGLVGPAAEDADRVAQLSTQQMVSAAQVGGYTEQGFGAGSPVTDIMQRQNALASARNRRAMAFEQTWGDFRGEGGMATMQGVFGPAAAGGVVAGLGAHHLAGVAVGKGLGGATALKLSTMAGAGALGLGVAGVAGVYAAGKYGYEASRDSSHNVATAWGEVKRHVEDDLGFFESAATTGSILLRDLGSLFGGGKSSLQMGIEQELLLREDYEDLSYSQRQATSSKVAERLVQTDDVISNFSQTAVHGALDELYAYTGISASQIQLGDEEGRDLLRRTLTGNISWDKATQASARLTGGPGMREQISDAFSGLGAVEQSSAYQALAILDPAVQLGRLDASSAVTMAAGQFEQIGQAQHQWNARMAQLGQAQQAWGMQQDRQQFEQQYGADALRPVNLDAFIDSGGQYDPGDRWGSLDDIGGWYGQQREIAERQNAISKAQRFGGEYTTREGRNLTFTDPLERQTQRNELADSQFAWQTGFQDRQQEQQRGWQLKTRDWEWSDFYTNIDRSLTQRGWRDQDLDTGYERGIQRLDWSKDDMEFSWETMQKDKWYQRWQLDFSQRQSGMKRQWQTEDFATDRAEGQLQFGWQMEDIEENLRYATGRDRRNLLKQRDRATITQGMQEGRLSTAEDRAKQSWEMEEEAFEMRKKRIEEEEEQREYNWKKQYERLGQQRRWLDEDYARDRERNQVRDQWQDEDWDKEAARRQERISHEEKLEELRQEARDQRIQDYEDQKALRDQELQEQKDAAAAIKTELEINKKLVEDIELARMNYLVAEKEIADAIKESTTGAAQVAFMLNMLNSVGESQAANAVSDMLMRVLQVASNISLFMRGG